MQPNDTEFTLQNVLLCPFHFAWMCLKPGLHGGASVGVSVLNGMSHMTSEEFPQRRIGTAQPPPQHLM